MKLKLVMLANASIHGGARGYPFACREMDAGVRQHDESN